jgi:hypothetical protein
VISTLEIPTGSARRIRTEWLIVLIGLAAFCYVALRAVLVGPTYDEVSTLEYRVPETVLDAIRFTDPNPGNHMLNTLAIKLAFAIGPQSLFVARLPNVCAFAVYLYFAYRIARQIRGVVFSTAVFVLLIANPFLLDFFGLARGYGLALAAQLASMYYVMVIPTSANPARTIALAQIAAAVSVLAVLSWLYSYVALGCVGLAVVWLQRREVMRSALVIAMASAASLFALISGPVWRMQRLQKFFYGGSRDLYHDTLTSLAKYSAYSPDVTRLATVGLNAFLGLLAAAAVISIIGGVHRASGTRAHRADLAMLAVLAFTVGTMVAQHVLLGSPYPIDRGTLVLYPIMVLAVCLALDRALGRTGAAVIVSVVGVCAVANVVVHANFYKTALWYFDAHTREILTALNRIGAERGKVQTLEFAWPYEQSVRYEIAHASFPFVRIVRELWPRDQTDFNPAADYYIHLGTHLEKLNYDPAAQKALARADAVVFCFAAEATCVYRLRH